MRYSLLILGLFLANFAFAQWGTKMNPNPQPIIANYFVIGLPPDSSLMFNALIEKAVPEYHLVMFDTASSAEYEFAYKSNQDKLHITYENRLYNADADLRINGVVKISEIKITGHFLTVLKIYNALFTNQVTIEELKEHGQIGAPILYRSNSSKYWIYMSPANGEKSGYWWIRLNSRS